MYKMDLATITPYHGKTPSIGENSFLAAGAHIIGDVVCGEECSFWFNTVVRGDCHSIRIGARTNVQDGTVIHVESDDGPTSIGSDVTIGHGAIVHACTVGDECLIGMGSTVLDGAVIPNNCLVAAGALVTPGKEFEPGWLIRGAPAKAARRLTDDEVARIRESAKRYLGYMKGYMP